MSEIQDLLNKATTLGEAIAAHERVKAFQAAQQVLQQDAEASKLLVEYQTHVEHIHKLEAGQQPIEVADKQKLQQLESGMSANAAVAGLMRAQADYIEMMEQVNRAMSAPLAAGQKSQC